MEDTTINIEGLYEEIKERAFDEGAFSQEEWESIVDDVLEQKREWTEADDVDWEEMKESLRARFEDFEAEIPVM
jgi:hypothetical protein